MNFKICLFFLSLIFAIPTFAKSYHEIQVCSEAGFFPFEMRTSSGEWKGYDIDLVKKFAKNTGRKIKFIDMSFDGLIPALLANKGCDMVVSAVGINAEREKIVLFSQPTYRSAYAGIIRASDADKYNSFNNINKKGVRIAVQQGTEASLYVKQNFTNADILTYSDNSTPINSIITNKVDMLIDDSVYSSVAVKRQKGRLALAQPNIFPGNAYGGMGFLFRKSDKNLCDEFNKFFDKIKKNGELDKLQKYYFIDMEWMHDFPTASK